MSERAGSRGDAPPASGGAFRVLVVDDDPDMAAFLGHLLGKEGMSSEIAVDAGGAIATVEKDPPDLILLDVMMPGHSGFALCERLKRDEATALIPVVLVTALEDQESRVRGIEAGADDFLSKPIKREELLARVKTLRRLHETRKELEARRSAEEQARREALRRTFLRYVSPRLADRILDEGGEQGVFRDLSERAAVVVLFADLRGFTRLSETVEASRIVPMLNEFFTILTGAAHDNDGTVLSMAGDSLLVAFNIPVPQTGAVEKAVSTGRGMIERFAPLGSHWKSKYGVETGVGVGIEAGDVVVGNVGSPSFTAYTVIGDTVNVAARLMQKAGPGEIMVGPGAFASLEPVSGAGVARYRREVTLRGKSEPLEVLSIKVGAAGQG